MLEIVKSNRENLVVIASETSGESFVFDGVAGEFGRCLGTTKAGYLLADWENSGNGIEVISPDKFGTISLDDEQMDESFDQLFGSDSTVLVVNPFGGWLADKVSGVMQRRKATKAFKKRLKAESYLDRAKEAEISAITAVKKKPSRTAKKKKFDVNFYADGEFHQATVTAANKTAAINIAKKGQPDFHLDSIEEAKEGWF